MLSPNSIMILASLTTVLLLIPSFLFVRKIYLKKKFLKNIDELEDKFIIEEEAEFEIAEEDYEALGKTTVRGISKTESIIKTKIS